MLDFHDIEQNSDEWLSMRGGRLTSSELKKVMANFGKAFGAPAKKYAAQIAQEQITGKPEKSSFHSPHFDRGHEQEPIIRAMYEEDTFTDVTNGGFFCNDRIGCSPDGLVGNDGLIEIKSAQSDIHFERVKSQTFDSAYKWQLIGNMKFTNRDWIDFISGCLSYPRDKQIYIYRLWADDFKDEFKMIDERLEEFFELVAVSRKVITESNYHLKERQNLY